MDKGSIYYYIRIDFVQCYSLDSYSRGYGFENQMGRHLSWLRFFVSSIPSGKYSDSMFRPRPLPSNILVPVYHPNFDRYATYILTTQCNWATRIRKTETIWIPFSKAVTWYTTTEYARNEVTREVEIRDAGTMTMLECLGWIAEYRFTMLLYLRKSKDKTRHGGVSNRDDLSEPL
jgi:hypothetical protein